MARKLPSDPELLLQYMDEIDSDYSDDEFDGFVDENESENEMTEEGVVGAEGGVMVEECMKLTM